MLNRTTKLAVIKFVKDFLLASRVLQIFQPLSGLFLFFYNFNKLTSWVHKHKKDTLLLNDFYRPVRNYDDRLKSFNAIVEHYKLTEIPVYYLEFGVAQGHSFKWWLEHCKHKNSKFIGFDTFEGLPEDWGLFQKGDMNYGIPNFNDTRSQCIKGIFQDTLNPYLFSESGNMKGVKKIIHMDADIFSATLFVLMQIYPYLEKGDIIMFDEFNVYGHEFQAYRLFTECSYMSLKLIAAQNNFYHAAFEVA
ncbi:MAG: class I SAM-dependent methyltransferase [Chitinophagia bacterium]|nr:class I SAM-dependent methyltransferase [Chitinophagia bacterium]